MVGGEERENIKSREDKIMRGGDGEKQGQASLPWERDELCLCGCSLPMFASQVINKEMALTADRLTPPKKRRVGGNIL